MDASKAEKEKEASGKIPAMSAGYLQAIFSS
jgi:hypothetical protein